jgi:hypothetical protein
MKRWLRQERKLEEQQGGKQSEVLRLRHEFEVFSKMQVLSWTCIFTLTTLQQLKMYNIVM